MNNQYGKTLQVMEINDEINKKKSSEPEHYTNDRKERHNSYKLDSFQRNITAPT